MEWDQEERALLALVSMVELEDRYEVTVTQLAEERAVDAAAARRRARRLYENGLIRGIDVSTLGTGFDLMDLRLTAAGRRVLGTLP